VSSTVRMAIVGCGAAARGCHLPAFGRAPEIRLTALIDPVIEHAAAAAAWLKGQGYPGRPVIATSVSEVVDQFDAAIVCAPHTAHAAVAGDLLAQGKHVLCEKPMTTSGADADRLAAATGPGTLLAMAHPRRLFPAYSWVRDLLADGALGSGLRVRWREGHPYAWEPLTSSMFAVDLAGGGVLTDTGSHVLDTLLWWFGPDAEITRYQDNYAGGVETDCELWLRWPGVGVTADVAFSRLRPLGLECEVRGDAATVTIGTDFPAGRCTLVSSAGEIRHDGDVHGTKPELDEWEGLFVEQLRNFIAAIEGTEPVFSSAADGRRVVSLIERCYGSEGRGAMPQPWLAGEPVSR